MKILVAGGAGYIGSVLTPRIRDLGHEVEVVDLLWFGNHLPSEIKVIQKDLMNLKEDDLRSYDQVLFIAGLSNDPMAEFSPSRNFVENAALPAYLCYIAKRAGVKRFIYGCSCSVYGYSADQLSDENSFASSNYPYGISKLQGEFACLRLQDNSFSTISLRKGTLSGYSPRMRLDLIINTMFKTAIAQKVINVNNPSIWRPILDVRDAASAYIRAIEAEHGVSGVFNIAQGNYTVCEVAEIVKDGVNEATGTNASLNIRNIEDFRNYKVSCEKAKNVLGFHPQFGVRDIVASLAGNLDHFKDLNNPDYYNIEVFKKIEGK